MRACAPRRDTANAARQIPACGAGRVRQRIVLAARSLRPIRRGRAVRNRNQEADDEATRTATAQARCTGGRKSGATNERKQEGRAQRASAARARGCQGAHFNAARHRPIGETPDAGPRGGRPCCRARGAIATKPAASGAAPEQPETAMSATRKPRGDDQAEAPSGDAVRPVVPAIPSESGVGEEDPGDFENASIRSDDGKRPSVPPRKPGERG